MRRLAVVLSAALFLIAAATSDADPSEYGIKSFSAKASTDQAGAHPDFTLSFELKREASGQHLLPATTRDISFDLPPGLLANPNAIPKCSAAQLVATDIDDKSNQTGCAQDSQVGITQIAIFKGSGLGEFTEPVYNMASPGGDVVARFGLIAQVYPVFIDIRLRPGDYGGTATIKGASSLVPLLSATTTTWGVPAAASHDFQRITAYEGFHNGGAPETPNGRRSSGLALAPFMINPTRCGVLGEVKATATSYALPNEPSVAIAAMPPVTGCGALSFEPKFAFHPTASSADSPAGMDVQLSLPQDGLQFPDVLAEAHLRRAVVTLPKGLTLNPAAASGLGACSEAQIGLASESPIRFNGASPTCPASSKVGTAEIKTPLLPEPIGATLYIARQDDNPFHTLLSGYLVAQGQGVTVKLAGRFDIDPVTQQITATFDENPQTPFEAVTLHFKEGPRGVLITPPSCGTYFIHTALTPWSAVDSQNPTLTETVSADSPFAIDSGPEGSPCPAGRFDPSLEAWTTKPLAGQYSPFVLRLSRSDGTQRLAALNVAFPPGLTGKLAGIPYCSEAAIAIARARSGLGQGAEELASPSCPAQSQVGEAVAGAGAGPTPFFVDTGRAYLAGPYEGAPLSMVVISPAVTGPFDFGDVVVRVALRLNPETAEITAISDPLPTALQGIPLDIRDVRVSVDRPEFTLNPTDCSPNAIEAEAFSTGGAVARLSEPFHIGGCRNLGFEPKLSLRLHGKANRGAHPRLTAVLRTRPGDANIAFVQAALPRSEFIENAHFKTICTRVQFAANACPKGSIYGHAKAFSPLLDQPLEGPVYLRSSSHTLPDLVIALKGQVDFNAVARVDSVNGGIRTTFEAVPDAPVSKVVLKMQGGQKGLIVNSRNLCTGTQRALVNLRAQNAKAAKLTPALQNDCAKGGGGPDRRR